MRILGVIKILIALCILTISLFILDFVFSMPRRQNLFDAASILFFSISLVLIYYLVITGIKDIRNRPIEPKFPILIALLISLAFSIYTIYFPYSMDLVDLGISGTGIGLSLLFLFDAFRLLKAKFYN